MWSVHILGYEFYFLFFNFMIYGFLGWVYESGLVSLQHKTWVNRGFMNGPVIPLYGAAATLIYITLSPVADNLILIFLGGMVTASILEFITSYVMEKLFHAKWWDYSHMKFNIQGRISLSVSLFWGLLSVIMVRILQPGMNAILERLPRRESEAVGYVILVLFIADLAVTVVGTVKLDKVLAEMQKIREDIKEYIESKRIYDMHEEWKQWFDQHSLKEWMAGIDKQTFFQEIEERLRKYLEGYQKLAGKKLVVQKRLLKAFPNLKSTDRESALKDLKIKLLDNKKKANDRKGRFYGGTTASHQNKRAKGKNTK